MAVAETETPTEQTEPMQSADLKTSGFPPSPSTLPLETDWEKALKINVQDQEGKQHEFGSLLQPDADTDTVLVIFGMLELA